MEYKCKVQYLESTGSQYIDTGVKPDYANGDRTEISFYRAELNNTYAVIFGSRTAQVRNGFYFVSDERTGSTPLLYVACDSTGFVQTQMFLSYYFEDVKMAVENGDITTVSEHYNGTYTFTQQVTSEYSVYLFALNSGGTMSSSYPGMKLYDWKYYRNGTLAQHLIPVLDSNNVPCMYDTVSGQLFYNKGTGQFLYGAALGPVISAIPFLMRPLSRIYGRRLQYLESTGTQYIDTGVKPDLANGDEVEISCYKVTGTGNQCIFGSRQSPALNGFYVLGQTIVSCDASGYASAPFFGNGFISMSVDDAYIKYGDTEIAQTKRVTCAYNTYLFALNNGGSATAFYSGIKIYDWKYWHNGKLTQHLIPVLDSNDVPCMFDTITGTYYYNAGTGTFNYA